MASRSSKAENIIEFDLEAIRAREEAVNRETDEQIIERMNDRFTTLSRMTSAIKQGEIRAMIVSGPPGVGKSYGVEEILHKEDLFNTLAQRKPKFEIVKGAMSAIGLYSKLYEYSNDKNVVVFDDCDSVLLDELSLNILKGALDTSKRRWISWNTDSRVLRGTGTPNTFEFKGGVIFITNVKFDHIRSKKLRDHLEALESRCHYIDLEMDTEREKILRIKQMIAGGMLDERNLDVVAKNEIFQFITENKSRLREISLRTVLKVADLRNSFPDTWKIMANTTIMRRNHGVR